MAVGDRLADVDLALTLSLAGWVIATDPSCRVYGATIDQPLGSGFMSGMWSERLFWRHAKLHGLIARNACPSGNGVFGFTSRRAVLADAGPSARPTDRDLPVRALRGSATNLRRGESAGRCGDNCKRLVQRNRRGSNNPRVEIATSPRSAASEIAAHQ